MSDTKELRLRIKQLENENAKLKKENEIYGTVRKAIDDTILGSVDTLKAKNNSRVSTRVNFRENDSYITCIETAYDSLNCFFKTISEFKRAAFRVGLMTILIEFGRKAEKGDIHYGLPEINISDKIKRLLNTMLKLASIEHDNIIKRIDKEFEERKNFAVECSENTIDKSKLDKLDKLKENVINIYIPDFNVNVDNLGFVDGGSVIYHEA